MIHKDCLLLLLFDTLNVRGFTNHYQNDTKSIKPDELALNDSRYLALVATSMANVSTVETVGKRTKQRESDIPKPSGYSGERVQAIGL